MSAAFSPNFAVLPPPQRAVWVQLAALRGEGWVLYGGTAIALRLGHRSSVDFDFFTSNPLVETDLRRALPLLASAEAIQQSENALTVLTEPAPDDTRVKLSFFGGIDFGRVGNPACTADGVAAVASLDDLMATKLKVILQRVEAKDYLDIAAMLRAHVDLARGLASARCLFGTAFPPGDSLKALTWFKGGDLADVPMADRDLIIQTASSVDALPIVERISASLDDR